MAVPDVPRLREQRVENQRAESRHAAVNLVLRPPAAAATEAPVLSPDQDAVVRLGAGSGPVLVLGAPGTGKSTVLVESAVRRIEEEGLDPAGVLLIAPSRIAAARLRNALTQRMNRTLSTSPARTWASYAFDVIRRAKVEGLLPLDRAPRLLSGPEQDLLIAELLEGHRLGLGAAVSWPEDLHGAVGTRGFRQEIRQLLDRVIEYGVTPGELADLGGRALRPDWTAAAQLFAEYRDLVDLRMPEAFDPAGIITAARQVLTDNPEFLAAERDRLRLVLVDDLQEANPAIYEFLAVLGQGQDVIATACPDTVVQGFRGARPDLVTRFAELLGTPLRPAAEATLTESHRLPPVPAERWQAVAGRIARRRAAAGGRTLHPVGDGSGTSGAVTSHLVDSAVHEQRYVAQRILEAQLTDGHGPENIAVIVRTGGQLAEMARYLSAQGIPVKVPVAETAVRDEVAVRPLLQAFEVVVGRRSLDADLAVELLTSRIGGASTLELRRLRQALRREELLAGDGRGSDALLVEALEVPAVLEPLGRDAGAARRIARMLAAGRRAVEEPGCNAETVLWALWDASGLSARWADQALRGGPSGLRADRDLDAMMALFQTAERYVDQLPGSTARQFIDYVLGQELPMDTLAKRAQVSEAVEILTPASAAGREWDVVIIPGLQEGVWPDTRLRGELLGSALFVDVMESGERAARAIDPAARLRDIRYDELRMFSTALSRARQQAVCVGVASEDAQPSQFLDLADPWPDADRPRPVTVVQRPMTLRALAAELRQAVQQYAGHPREAADAAAALARLAASPNPVPGAHPASWWGLAPLTTDEPVVPPGEPVAVSPSRVEAVHKSPLDWFVQAAGGEPAVDFARSLGTLVHAIAQDLPEATGSEYVAELTRRWPSLRMPENWESRADFRRAETMVRKLAEYTLLMRAEGRRLQGVEVDFTVDLPGSERAVRLRGQIDRLEIDSAGRPVVIDLKTGKSKPTAAELERHAQLGAYQAAIRAGAFRGTDSRDVPGGAALVQLGGTVKKVQEQFQEPLTAADDWATELVLAAADLMSGNSFTARHDPKKARNGSHGCRLPEVCPLCTRGKQVTQ